MAVARSRSECASISAAASVFPLLLPGKGFRVFLVRLLSGSARVSPSGFGEYRPRRLTQLTRQCRCAPSKSLSSNQQEKERSTPHFVCGPTGIRNCSTRASTVLHARALSCWPPYSPGCHAYFPTRLTSERAFSTCCVSWHPVYRGPWLASRR